MEPNDRQREAIESPSLHNVTVAGPGTGKSKVLLLRAAHLISEGSQAKQVVLSSFTNASVRDLRNTADENDDYEGARQARKSTFHSLALRSLRRMEEAEGQVFIADDWEERELIDPYLKGQLGLARVTTARNRRRDFDARWCQATEDPTEWLSQNDRHAFQQAWDRVKQALDFMSRGELTYRWWLKLSSEPAATNSDLAIDFAHILVDEYQDLNECEHSILEILGRRGVGVFVVGDPNQSIYEGLRHAHPELCHSFAARFADSEQIILNETYRCPESALDAARALMRDDKGVTGIPDVSHRDTLGQFLIVNYPSQEAEASGIAQAAKHLVSDNPEARVLILAPARQVAAVISSQLDSLSLPYATTFAPKAVQEDDARKAIAIARLLKGEPDSLAAATLIILCSSKSRRSQHIVELVNNSSGDGITAYELLFNGEKSPISGSLSRACRNAVILYEKYKQMSLEEAINSLEQDLGGVDLEQHLLPAGTARPDESDESEDGEGEEEEASLEVAPPGITLTTFHSSKGLQADYVLVAAVEPPFFEEEEHGSLEEKRRLLFVAITRGLTLTAVSFASRRYGASRYASSSAGSRRGPSILVEQLEERLDTEAIAGGDFIQLVAKMVE